LLSVVAASNSNSTCMTACLSDSDCSCGGSDGKCLGRNAITKLCVNVAVNPPTTPVHLPVAVDWPEVWSADMTTITYNDYSDKVKHQGGRFFYDWPHRRQKQDFGTTALLYVGANASEPGHKSKFYFVAFGFACFYVDTEDPITHVDIGPPAPDFMGVCADEHMAAYVGREKVAGEWADHYTCSVEYDNQTIAFQAWHSLGLGPTQFGVPLALSSGDSNPNWQAPRLTTTTYTNFSVGPQAAPAHLFQPPKLCIPIPQSTLTAGLGLGPTEPLFSALSREEVRARALLMLGQKLLGS